MVLTWSWSCKDKLFPMVVTYSYLLMRFKIILKHAIYNSWFFEMKQWFLLHLHYVGQIRSALLKWISQAPPHMVFWHTCSTAEANKMIGGNKQTKSFETEPDSRYTSDSNGQEVHRNRGELVWSEILKCLYCGY